MIVGIALGALIFIAVIVGVCCCCKKDKATLHPDITMAHPPEALNQTDRSVKGKDVEPSTD